MQKQLLLPRMNAPIGKDQPFTRPRTTIRDPLIEKTITASHAHPSKVRNPHRIPFYKYKKGNIILPVYVQPEQDCIGAIPDVSKKSHIVLAAMTGETYKKQIKVKDIFCSDLTEAGQLTEVGIYTPTARRMLLGLLTLWIIGVSIEERHCKTSFN